MQMMTYRQGDVKLIEVSDIDTSNFIEVPREDNAIVLAHGEVTGHKHQIRPEYCDDGLFVTDPANNNRYLKLAVEGFLTHEEHLPIKIKPNKLYRVLTQVEYEAGELVPVVD